MLEKSGLLNEESCFESECVVGDKSKVEKQIENEIERKSIGI